MILAIDCSDKACSVALSAGDYIYERYTDQARQHARQLKPMYRELLAEADVPQSEISTVAVSAGPGSFTGLRIGFGFAQGLAFALDVPLLAISSLEALAQTELGALDHCDRIEVAFDARMGEIYGASFAVKEGMLARVSPDQLVGQDAYAPDTGSQVAHIGSAFALPAFDSLESGYRNPDACIRATAVLSLANIRLYQGETGRPALGAEPAYLRRENAWKTLDQQGKSS